ncbi:MAG: bifunctional oligoribonuclease/PAP phosphatase NrnA [Raoultibacter sp.]
MITPQTNTDLASLAGVLKDVKSVALCGHISPDGDCLGSQLALSWALRALGKKTICLLAKDDPIEGGLRFLPGVDEMVCASDFTDKADVFIACDVPSLERLGLASEVHARCALTITIDHHARDDSMSQLNYVDPAAPSTTMIIWELLKHLGVEVTPVMATCAYTGLVTDTGRFQFQNTTHQAFIAAAEMSAAGADPSEVSREVFQNRSFASVMLFRRAIDHLEFDREAGFAFSYLTLDDFAQCGAVKSDAEPLIDELRSLSGVRIASILRDQGSEVRGSLRSKDATDVAAIAARFGGGGHKAAAGFTFEGPLDQAIVALRAAVAEVTGGFHAADAAEHGQK